VAVIRITKEFKFEMAHALYGHDGPCRHLHGHSYELFVTIKGEPLQDPDSSKNGMVMDFGDLKKIVRSKIIDRFDHALVLNTQTPMPAGLDTFSLFDNMILVDFQPSSENLLVHFAELIKPELPANVELYSMKLRETVTSYAEWFHDDNP
jgi:6-pyruvoyltetrahydropterin/6-carboxytetrahydropterin synthase